MSSLKRVRVLSEACQVVRPVSICAAGIAIVACAMAISGWRLLGVAMGGVLVAIAGALVYQVHRAVTHLRRQSLTARQGAAEAERHYVEVLRRIIGFVEGRDKYWAGHSENVGRLAGQIARRMRLPDDRCELLALAGQLHDIGLIAIPDAVMKNHSRFGVEEFRTIQRHSEVSYEVLKPLEMLAGVLPAIRSHHERLNGTGYPAGLTGQAIPLEARILAVADAYDALTHDRPHRQAVSALLALREIRRCSPSGYDPPCVEALAGIINGRALEEALAGQASIANR